MIIANANGKNLTEVIIQFCTFAALADRPDMITNHVIITNDIKARSHHSGCQPNPSQKDCKA
jgi:hypothetical protein